MFLKNLADLCTYISIGLVLAAIGYYMLEKRLGKRGSPFRSIDYGIIKEICFSLVVAWPIVMPMLVILIVIALCIMFVDKQIDYKTQEPLNSHPLGRKVEDQNKA